MAVQGYGCRSMVEPLRRVVVRRPDSAFAVEDHEKWHYSATPNLDGARREHEVLVKALRTAGAEVIYHEEAMPDHADAIYVHDPVIVTHRGAVVLRMGKALRRGEEDALARLLERVGVPIHCRLEGEATAEGGDLMWLDRNTLAAGRGYRTNSEGIRQLKEALADLGVEVIQVDLPDYGGPESCLHLMSFISLVDHDLAVIYRPLMPESFYRLLQKRGFAFVEVPEGEFETMGANVLTLAPRYCLMLEGNPITGERLEAAGCRVQTISGNEISLKSEGGPTCLTRPILRSA